MPRKAKSNVRLEPLDALNFFVADAREGTTPYLSLLLAGLPGWTPSQIGWILTASGTANLLTSAPIGLAFDQSKNKRALLLGALFIMGLCAFALTQFSAFLPLLAIQVFSGLANALIGPGILAISLGVVGAGALAGRIARNESFNYLGNCVGALICASVVRWTSNLAPFFIAMAMAFFAIGAMRFIRPGDINDAEARGFRFNDRRRVPLPLRTMLKNRPLLFFLLVALTFQFANASLLPIATQIVARRSADDARIFLTWGVVLSQLTAVPAATLAGILSRRLSSRACLALGLAAISLRAALFATVTDLHVLIAAQVLDGVAAGVLAVAPILALAKVVEGTGHFTFTAGMLSTAISLGASVSMIVSGYLFQYYGADTYYAVVFVLPLALILLLLWQLWARRRPVP